MANYNEGGVEYQTYRQNVVSLIGGHLPHPVLTEKVRLVDSLYEEASQIERHEFVRGWLGILHHLDAFLLSIERIVGQVETLKSSILEPHPNPEFPKIYVKRLPEVGSPYESPCLIGISSQRIEIELETLLLRAVAFLERLTLHISSELGIGKLDKFFGLEAALAKADPSDVRGKLLYSLVQNIKPHFLGLVLSDSNKSLRNIVAHRASSPEIMQRGFSINWISEDKLLAFDAELGQFPLIGSVRRLAESVPFFAMESFRILLSGEANTHPTKRWADSRKFSQVDFAPIWSNPFLHYESFVDPSGAGPLVSLVKWAPGGFKSHQLNLRPEIFDLAVKPIRHR